MACNFLLVVPAMFDFIVIHLFCLNRVEESRGPVWKERLLVPWGAEGETVKVSAERPAGQVQSLGVQGGPDGRNGLRTGGMEQSLLQVRKCWKLLK